MSAQKRYRVAIIGCGNIALAGHLPAVLAHRRFELTGLCDLRPAQLDLARQLCGSAKPALCSDYRELIRHADAFILALHPEHSVEVAIDLLQRGLPVLDEKPLAATLEDGARLAAAVQRSSAPYQIGFIFRYWAMLADVANWLSPLGGPRFYQVAVYDERPSQHQADGGRMIQGILRNSSAITHEGSHVLDWMSVLHPRGITSVQAGAIRSMPDYAGPNLWSCQFTYTDGSLLHLTIGWLLEDLPPCTLRALCPGGQLDLNLSSGQGQLSRQGQASAVATEPLRQNWAQQLDQFAHALDQGRAQPPGLDAGLAALHATVAAERSFRTKATVNLPDGLLI